ncbi:MAG: DUF2721 domain-containing protein [Pseudomonadota bacterium]
MVAATEPISLSQGIQLAVAPVFLLTAVASLIGSVAARLSRIIDRARLIEERLESQTAKNVAASYRELDTLKLRGRLVNASITLLTLCGVMIGLTVMELFLAETTALRSMKVVPTTFLAGIILFVLALLCFLAETLLAAHVLRFGRHLPRKTSDHG